MLVKKLSLGLVTLTVAASPVLANHHHTHAPKNRFYVGADIQSNKLRLDKNLKRVRDNGSNDFFKTNLGGVSLLGGYRWDSIGAELGYTLMHVQKYTGTFTDGRTTVVGNLEQTDSNSYIDALYYHPINHNFDLKALLGVGFLRTEFKGSVGVNGNGFIARSSGSHTETKAGVRVGLGGQYYFTSDFSSTLMVKYQTGNDYFRDMTTLSLGLAYHF